MKGIRFAAIKIQKIAVKECGVLIIIEQEPHSSQLDGIPLCDTKPIGNQAFPIGFSFIRVNQPTPFWSILLILAGLMEFAFTFSLGKTKTTIGAEQIWWYAGFLVALSSVCF